MSSEVRHLVDHERPVPLVRLTGVLDADTSATVRSILLDVLAGQPTAVVVDVHDLETGPAATVGAFLDVQRDTADWPAADLLLCGVTGPPWPSLGWPVWPDAASAYASLGDMRAIQRLSIELEPHVGAARRCRELITEACARWDRPALAGPACIVATEMVNNVVAHAHTEMTMLLAVRGNGLSVAVRDESGVVPSYSGAPVAPTAYGGRGMLLIDSVAERWGSLALSEGKVVWALLPGPETTDQRGNGSMIDPGRG